MNKKLLITLTLILGIVVTFSLCAKNEKTQATHTPTIPTSQETPKIQTPRPPEMRTPLTPDYYIGKFVEYFNERNVTALYDLFSDRIRRNHSIEELEMALKFAKEHNVTIVKWRIVKGRFFPGNNIIVEIKVSKNEKIVNKTIAIPMIYVPFKKGSEIINVGYINRWIIDDILS